MLWKIIDLWDCIWYYSRGKVRCHVINLADGSYGAYASNGLITVSNCYGSTPGAAKEMALFKLKEAIKREPLAPLD